MNIANLSETDLRYHTTDKFFQRGEDYYRRAQSPICVSGGTVSVVKSKATKTQIVN